MVQRTVYADRWYWGEAKQVGHILRIGLGYGPGRDIFDLAGDTFLYIMLLWCHLVCKSGTRSIGLPCSCVSKHIHSTLVCGIIGTFPANW